jgi:hypothetical protein
VRFHKELTIFSKIRKGKVQSGAGEHTEQVELSYLGAGMANGATTLLSSFVKLNKEY